VKPEDTQELVEYRLEQAEVALEDARFLIDGGRSPQSIVNRAYYAMFYAAMALLQRTGNVPSKHAGVISVFDTDYVLKGVFPRELSKSFHRAFELRQVCDYKVIEPVSAEKAEGTWRNAVQFVEAVKAYLSSPPAASLSEETNT
jgi:uncharacterized protein (UPF0332 family)